MSMKAKPLPMDIIRDALKLDPTSRSHLTWKERPQSHFDCTGKYGEYRWRGWNTRFAGSSAGTERPNGCGNYYFVVTINNRPYKAHRIVYALAHGIDAIDLQIDHIDGDGLNNKPDNLRLATKTENMQNREKTRKNTSGKKGVCWHNQAEKWLAQIKINGRHVSLGLFESINEASAAYEAAAREHFGEFYREGRTDALAQH